VDLIELNEAFAAQALADGYALADQGWDWDKVNVNGGAIAMGHPLGASGARVLTTLIYALKDRGLKRGIASLCLGGGEAVAMAIELDETSTSFVLIDHVPRLFIQSLHRIGEARSCGSIPHGKPLSPARGPAAPDAVG